MRALGVDLGARRIGLAVSSGSVASPLETIERSGDESQDHRRLLAVADEFEVGVIVVGMPYSLDGSVGPAARAIEAEIGRLGAATSIPIETYDERLTTVTASRRLHERGVRARAQRRVIDQVAASVLLQAWLDQRAGSDS